MAAEQEIIGGRLEEVGEIVKGLESLDQELRQAAGQNLGRVEHTAYIGLTAQATMIATLRQTLRVRMEMLQKARNDLQAQNGSRPVGMAANDPLTQERPFPRRVDVDEDAPEHG